MANDDHSGRRGHPLPSPQAARPRRGARLLALVSAAWKHRWFLLLASGLVGVALWQSVRVIVPIAIVVDAVARGDLVQTVVASGHVETPFRVEIGSQLTGTVAEVPVDEGQRVVRGQPLVVLDTRELKATVVLASGAVAQAEARLRQMVEFSLPAAREARNQAQANLTSAERAFERADSLARSDYATRASLDEAQRALNVARAQMRSAELQVFTMSPGGSDHVMAQTQLDQARAALDAAKSRLDYATIVAPRDGVLITRNVERGTVVQPGRVLLVLAPAGATQVVVQIDERNLGLIALGQKALVSADAYPDRRFAAVVSYINPSVDLTRASVEIKLTVPDPPDYLRQDMTVSIDVEVERRVATLILPLRSVRDRGAGAPWVMGVRDGRAYRQPVRIGLVGGAQAEIVDGLAEGALAVPATAGLLPGQRLRPLRR